MVSEILTPANIVFVLGLLGIMFSIYHYFRDPQVKSDKMDALLELKVSGLEKSVKTILENHLPHLDQRMVDLRDNFYKLNESVIRLSTVIDERIPKR